MARHTLHRWLARNEAEGLDGLVDRSHRPVACPHQMSAAVEAVVLELQSDRRPSCPALRQVGLKRSATPFMQ